MTGFLFFESLKRLSSLQLKVILAVLNSEMTGYDSQAVQYRGGGAQSNPRRGGWYGPFLNYEHN